jgi:hypothetical protein
MTHLRRGSALVLSGSTCVVAAWFLFALHDASVKLLVAELSAWQILFARSMVVLPLCGLIGGQRDRALGRGVGTPVLGLVRGLVRLPRQAAWERQYRRGWPGFPG